MDVRRPSGSVTFLFTDIEGSTERWDRFPAAMRLALRRHDEIVRTGIEACGGFVFKTIGDAFCAAFSVASDAVLAARRIQAALAAADWSAVDGLRVRMALHRGVSDERADDYFGPTVNRVARLLSIAHGGQVIFSAAVHVVVDAHLPAECASLDLGEHRLKHIDAPERVFQLLAPELDQTFAPLRSVSVQAHNLADPLTTFIEHDDGLAQIEGLIARNRLVTLVGAGGIGKSRYALEVGHRMLERFPDGVWFVELAPIDDPHRVASAIGAVLNIRERLGTQTIDVLASALATKQVLLILDNCEHVIETVAQLVSRLLGSGSTLHVVATSREALRVAGETIYHVPALGSPDLGADRLPSLEDVRNSPAVRLFLDRAIAANAQFAVRSDETPSLISVCRRLDGIPLAIELAAARMNALSVSELEVRLDDRFRLLTKGARTALPRQQTLRALIDWSFDLLGEREREIFAALSIFAGQFSLDAAAQVCAAPHEDEFTLLDLFTSLNEKSLVMRDPGVDRFYQLETTRFYAAEKLLASAAQSETARRHFRYYAAFATNAALGYETTNGREWLAGIRGVLDNLRTALSWSIVQQNDVAAGIVMTAALCEAWIGLGLDNECAERLDVALAYDRSDVPVSCRARLILARAQLAIRSQRAGIEPAHQAVQLYRSTDDRRGLASALNVLGYAFSREDRFAEADAAFEAALSIATQIANVRQRGLALLNLGVNQETAEHFDRARALYDEALELGTRHGDDYIIGAANLDMSVLCEAIDAPQDGFRYARNALDAYARAGDSNGGALALGNMTTNLIGMGRITEARTAAHDYVVHARAHRLDTTLIVALEKVAAIAQFDGDIAASAQLLGFTQARSAILGLKRDPGNVRFTDGLQKQVNDRLGARAARELAYGAQLSEAAATDLALTIVTDR